MPFHIGPVEILVVLAIILIVFGVGRLPEVGGAMGKAIHGFRKSLSGKEEQSQGGPKSPRRNGNSNNPRIIE